MRDIINQEKMFVFDEFKNEDAFLFGMKVLDIIKKENLKNVRIRVMLDNDIIFQYIMDGKKGEEWLNRKEKTVMSSHHSSLYVYENKGDYHYMQDNNEYAVCGGGFPLVIKGELRGCFIISGLAHEEDHDLIIKALEEMK